MTQDSVEPRPQSLSPRPLFHLHRDAEGHIVRPRTSRCVFPALLVLVTIIFTALGWSGTSIGVIAPSGPHASVPGLVVGTPRPIRSDEWNLSTPIIVAQSHHGYSSSTNAGIGEHDLAISDVPSTDWSTIFKPWDLPALVLNATQGFAARWWLMALFLLFGAYLLLLEVTDRTDIAVLFSLGLGLSPFFAWWYLSLSLDSVGFGMLALASFLYSFRAPTTTRRILWLGLAAYATIGFALLLYPPWLVPIALVMAAIGVCELVGRHTELEITWRRLGTDLGGLVVVVVVILAAYYLHTRGAIKAENDTILPGDRRVTGGGASLLQFLSAPFGLSLAQHGSNLATTNQSEISSFLLLGPFALLQAFRIRMRDLTFRWRLLLFGTGAVFVLLVAWSLISLPPLLAKLLLLNRVESYRSIIGVGVAGILLMAFLCAAEFRPVQGDASSSERAVHLARERQRRIHTGALVCAVAAFMMYFWAGRSFVETFPQLQLGLRGAGVASAGAAVVVLLTSARKVVAGGVAFVLFGAVMSGSVDPLYSGLGPLTTSPLLTTFTQISSHDSDPGHNVWLSFEGPAVNDVLIASGLHTLSAVQTYPDFRAWEILDPQKRAVDVWNRYAQISFVPGSSNTPTITLVNPVAINVGINPCSPTAGRLGIGFVVSPSPLANQCLSLKAHTTEAGGSLYPETPVYVYARTATSTS